MLALLALVAFIIGAVITASFHSAVFWICVGLALLAADALLRGSGYARGRFGYRE
jgi:hypothetical protein